jgi:hypothetical protein
LILRHVWRERSSWADLKTQIAATLSRFGVKKTLIENATVGVALADELRKFGTTLIGPVLKGMSDGIGGRNAKVERAIASGLLVRAEQNKLVLPSPESSPAWVQRYIDEVTGWTGDPAETSDQVDVSSYACWEVKQNQTRSWGGVIRV